MEFSTIDWITFGLYFIILVALGVYFSFRHKSAAQFFLAGRNTRWFAIGISIFAANIFSEHLIGHNDIAQPDYINTAASKFNNQTRGRVLMSLLPSIPDR